jgi:hypothetical protein
LHVISEQFVFDASLAWQQLGIISFDRWNLKEDYPPVDLMISPCPILRCKHSWEMANILEPIMQDQGLHVCLQPLKQTRWLETLLELISARNFAPLLSTREIHTSYCFGTSRKQKDAALSTAVVIQFGV